MSELAYAGLSVANMISNVSFIISTSGLFYIASIVFIVTSIVLHIILVGWIVSAELKRKEFVRVFISNIQSYTIATEIAISCRYSICV
jgi:hypothetical protein